ncbi:glycosyltransferase [Amycolatopsis sp. NPDC052450]|uniref:glycosyltransferase n=1 Tax=Amycolatopsis sp. NPDC052450 TaxID=3363937 RepID=UPI0037C702FD
MRRTRVGRVTAKGAVVDRKDFGARVQSLRTGAGLSLKTFGDLIHYSKAQISRVEHGVAPPTTTFAAACDRVLGTGDELARAAAVLAVDERRARAEPPCDLPSGPRKLIGRDVEASVLERHLSPAEPSRLPRVCVLYGMAGAGKTAIALWVAERLHHDYPDGCIYLDMQGYNPDSKPLGKDEALVRVLRRLGVPGELVPPSEEDRTALLRQKLAGRRVLVMLDNVSSAQQVHALRPPNGRSAVIIVSRQPLTVLDAALHQHVRALEPADAVALFTSVAELGKTERGDPTVVRKITEMCYRLPLAVCIVASRFRDNPARRLEDVAARLADQAARHHEFTDGLRSVTAVLEASCATLSDPQLAMLQLMAAHPGPRVDAWAAGALAGISPTAAEGLLDELIRAGMLEHHSHNAYRLHDVLRDHLRRPDAELLSGPEEDSARGRLFEYFLHAAAAADSHIDEHRYRLELDLMSPSVETPLFPDPYSAGKWMESEVDNFLPLLQEMALRREDKACWQFAYCLRGYFYATKQWELMTACYGQAMEAATRTGDHRAVAIVLNNLGLASMQLGRKDEAMELYARAQKEFSAVDDRFGEMNVGANRAWLAYERGDFSQGLDLSRRAWVFYCDQAQLANAAIALDCIARCELRLGGFAAAKANFEKVLVDYQKLLFRDGDIAQLVSHLAETEFRLGDFAASANHYRAAIDRARSGKAQREEAVAYEGLGRAAAAQGRQVDADAHRAAAIALYNEVGAVADVERLRGEQLAQVEQDREEVRGNEPRPEVTVADPGRVCVLAVNTEWSSRHGGGISTINRELCKALAAQGAEVYCSVPSASDEERRDAAAAGVHLVHPPFALGAPESALSRPPVVSPPISPDFVIGHGRKTGEAALWLVEDHYRDAKLLHFLHVVSDRVEVDKRRRDGDPAARADERSRHEIEIAKKAHLAIGVGPALSNNLRDHLRGSAGPEVVRLDPGFDVSEDVAETPILSDTVRVLLTGRLGEQEARIKGVDIAARALGHVLSQRGANEPEVELVLRGAEKDDSERLIHEVKSWAGTDSLRVVPRPYSSDSQDLRQDLHRANVVIMPSRSEGFGLVGLEAIKLGVPTLISKRSGLGLLLSEEQAELSVDLSNKLIPVTEEEYKDTLRWGDAIAAVLANPKPSFWAARRLRDEMAEKRTWAMAAETLLKSMREIGA